MRRIEASIVTVIFLKKVCLRTSYWVSSPLPNCIAGAVSLLPYIAAGIKREGSQKDSEPVLQYG